MKNERDGNNDENELFERTLSKSEFTEYLKKLPDWKIVHEDSLEKLIREYAFDNFSEVLKFTKSLERLAQEEDHHPVLKSTWGKVSVYLWTHKKTVIQEKDFLMALKSDNLYSKLMKKESE